MSSKVTLSGNPPYPDYVGPAPQPIDPSSGMHQDYYILSQEERAKGFVRPVRDTYLHTRCNTKTKMNLAIAETYARDPKFYSATFCTKCKYHFPVSEFLWEDGSELGS